MKTDERAARLISELGGQTCVARIFNISQPSVAGWVKNGIPSARLQTLQALAARDAQVKKALKSSGLYRAFPPKHRVPGSRHA